MKKLPLPLRWAKLVLTVLLYAGMLAMVLLFFTGNGMFLYEAL